MDRRERALRALFSSELDEIAVNKGRGTTHAKVRCVYNDHEFIYTTSIAGETNEAGREKKIRGELRRIKRAIDEQNDVIMGKYNVRRRTT